MLLKGTTTRTLAEQIAREIESVGGSIDSYGGNNSFGVNAEVLSSDFATGLDLRADVMLHPTFPAAALEREREIQLAGIRAQKDTCCAAPPWPMRRALFGDAGYGLDALGTEDQRPCIHADDLQAFHHAWPCPTTACWPSTAMSEPARCARPWRRRSALGSPATPPGLGPVGRRTRTSTTRVDETRDKKQAVLVIGFPGIDASRSRPLSRWN